MSEQKLIAAAIKDRGAYEKIESTSPTSWLTEEAKVVWEVIEKYYKKDQTVGCADPDILHAQLERAYPKHADNFKPLLYTDVEISPANIADEIVAVEKQAIGTKLAQALLSSNEAAIEELTEKYHKLREGVLDEQHKGAIYTAPTVGGLVRKTSGDNKIKLLPAAINQVLDGGALRQHHIVVFAPTDMGKTLFVMNMAYGFIKQGLNVLYCGNEDPGDDLMLRFLIRLTGMTKDEIRNNPERAQEIADKRGYDRFTLAELSPGTPREIRGLIEEYKPAVVIVDQLRNLEMREANKVLQLEKAATAMRNIGKEYNLLMVSVTQAGDSANGKTILDRGDIDYSNVGIPGQADLMIGIGATAEMEATGQRMLSFPKNKLGGIKQPLSVFFNTQYMKVE